MGLIKYVKETQGELKHVSWPSSNQTVGFSIVVVLISVVTAYYLGLFDFLLTKVIDFII
jgi:preprotein translocase subunit SecE